MKSEDTFALIFGIALISITIVGASNPGLRESLDLTRIPNPFQQDPKKIEVSLLDPKNQDNEALYYRSLMGIIETQIDLRDSAYQFSVPIDESMTRDICSSKYSVLEGLKGNGLPLGPEMNEKLNRLTTNMQC